MTLKDVNLTTLFPQEAEMDAPQETKHERQDCDIFLLR